MNTQGITQGIQPMIHQGNHFTNIGHMTNHITYLSSNDQFPMITQGITQGNPIFTRVLPRVIHWSLPPIHQGNDQLTYHYITNHWYYRILLIHQGIHQGNDQGKRQGNDQGNIAVAWDSAQNVKQLPSEYHTQKSCVLFPGTRIHMIIWDTMFL